mmetsp:Transcript_41949/g.43971  ORF Transcript_41949/g.43971 Transcript_41949/m.43971 type:complete len:225 (+) Transcript_41949:163-837(+)
MAPSKLRLLSIHDLRNPFPILFVQLEVLSISIADLASLQGLLGVRREQPADIELKHIGLLRGVVLGRSLEHVTHSFADSVHFFFVLVLHIVILNKVIHIRGNIASYVLGSLLVLPDIDVAGNVVPLPVFLDCGFEKSKSTGVLGSTVGVASLGVRVVKASIKAVSVKVVVEHFLIEVTDGVIREEVFGVSNTDKEGRGKEVVLLRRGDVVSPHLLRVRDGVVVL